jgi:hypothetical protein
MVVIYNGGGGCGDSMRVYPDGGGACIMCSRLRLQGVFYLLVGI